MATNILSAAEMQEKLAHHGRKSSVSHDEFVEALRLWIGARAKEAKERQEAQDALTCEELAQMAAFDRLDALRKGLILNTAAYYRAQPRADVTLGVLNVVTIMSDNDRGTCDLSHTSMGKLLARSRTAIAEAYTRLKAAGLIDSDKGRSGAHPIIPRLMAAQYNHVVWVLEAIQGAAPSGRKAAAKVSPKADTYPKPVGSTGQVQTANLSALRDRLGEDVGSMGQVDDACRLYGTGSDGQPVGSTGHNFTSSYNNIHTRAHEEAGQGDQGRHGLGDWRKGLSRAATQPVAETVITEAHGCRWLDIVSGWGLPVGQKAQTSVDENFAIISLKNIVASLGRGHPGDVVLDALELMLIDMEGKKYEDLTDKSHTGFVSAKRYFENTFPAKLSNIAIGRQKLSVAQEAITRIEQMKIDTERKVQERKLGALDAAIDKNVADRKAKIAEKEKSADPAQRTMEGGEKQLGGLTRKRAVELVASFLKNKIWSDGMKDALGSAPNTFGCTIPEDVIAEAHAYAFGLA